MVGLRPTPHQEPFDKRFLELQNRVFFFVVSLKRDANKRLRRLFFLFQRKKQRKLCLRHKFVLGSSSRNSVSLFLFLVSSLRSSTAQYPQSFLLRILRYILCEKSFALRLLEEQRAISSFVPQSLIAQPLAASNASHCRELCRCLTR